MLQSVLLFDIIISNTSVVSSIDLMVVTHFCEQRDTPTPRFTDVGLSRKRRIMNEILMYHAACKVEFQSFSESYSQQTFFQFLCKYVFLFKDVKSPIPVDAAGVDRTSFPRAMSVYHIIITRTWFVNFLSPVCGPKKI